MQSQIQRNIKLAKQKERMKKKAEQKSQTTTTNDISQEMFENANKAAIDLLISEGVKFEEMENLIFSTGENMKKLLEIQIQNLKQRKRRRKKRKQNK